MVVNDVAVVYKLLTDPDYGGYPPENVRLLINEQATKAAILDSLAEMALRTTPDATVLLYFSGHTGKFGADSPVYMIPVDVNPVDMNTPDFERTSISDKEFSSALRNIPAQQNVIIIDSCHAGGFLESLQGLRNELLLASSRADELSFVLPGHSNSLFTSYLIEGLQGGVPSTDGYIRVFALFQYVQERMSREEPRQHPMIKGAVGEDFPIALYRGGHHDDPDLEDSEPQPEESASVSGVVPGSALEIVAPRPVTVRPEPIR